MKHKLIVLKPFLLTLIFAVMLVSCSNSSKDKFTKEIYVSLQGDDSGNGSISEPFATIPAAVNKVRSLRKLGNLDPVTIYLREGRHQLNQTLVLGIEDGRAIKSNLIEYDEYGAGNKILPAYLTISAYPEEHPVVSAGMPITDWKKVETTSLGLPSDILGNVWEADMPKGLEKFYTLYDSNGRLNRARSKGFVPTKLGDKKTLHFAEETLKDWDNLNDVEINIRPNRAWVINMLPIKLVDEAKGIAKMGVSATYSLGRIPGWIHTKDGTSAWLENILEALNEPGEWVVNTKTRKIYLWPANPAKDGSPQGILAPTTSELIRVEGQIDYDGSTDNPVNGIAFKGLTFTHADRLAWTNEENRLGWGMQHDWDMFDKPSAMIRFRGAENCAVIDCDFFNSGGSGIRLDLYAQRNRVENCEFAHLGEAGILLAGYGAGTKDVNHHNDIINNHIHHFSEITWHSPGIWAWQSGYNHIANNFVHHSGYAAVLITNRVEPDRSLNGEGGRTIRQNEISEDVKASTKETYESWKVREKYNHSRHNLFEYNEITHAVQKLSDGNAIYVSGAGTSNIIRYNYIHDNLEHSFPAAIRCDDDQHETLIYGNILYNNYGFSAGIASKGVNDIINNFIVQPLVSPRWGYVSFEWASVKGSKVHHNIIISHPDGGNAHGERPITRSEDGHPLLVETDMDYNLYYHPTNFNWMDEHLFKMRSVGKEQESLFGNPLFINIENENFGFQTNSPALKLGIEPLDVTKMGLIKHIK